jgi:hypothetical protein
MNKKRLLFLNDLKRLWWQDEYDQAIHGAMHGVYKIYDTQLATNTQLYITETMMR